MMCPPMIFIYIIEAISVYFFGEDQMTVQSNMMDSYLVNYDLSKQNTDWVHAFITLSVINRKYETKCVIC